MKKIFVEPALHRIELNLRENIAASGDPGSDPVISMGYYFNVSLFGCTIQSTNKYVGEVTEEEAVVCLVANGARALGMIIPREDVLPHFKR